MFAVTYNTNLSGPPSKLIKYIFRTWKVNGVFSDCKNVKESVIFFFFPASSRSQHAKIEYSTTDSLHNPESAVVVQVELENLLRMNQHRRNSNVELFKTTFRRNHCIVKLQLLLKAEISSLTEKIEPFFVKVIHW